MNAIRWAFLAAMLAGTMLAGAGTRTWTGAVSTNWNDAGNWDGGLPGSTDDVIVTNTAVKPTMPAGDYPASGAFASFTVGTGAVVTCHGNTNAVNEASGGSPGSKHGSGVSIYCVNAAISGILDANGTGFGSQAGPGGASGGGGTHGGRGKPLNRIVYGQVRQPTALGSGGFAGGGGGAIRLSVTNTLELDGIVRANGTVGGTGGGSGGSIWLSAQTFQGTGSVLVIGSTAGAANTRGGGGGRIAIEHAASTFSGTVSASGGADAVFGPVGDGQAGTLWEPGRFSDTGAVVIADAGYQYYFPDTTTVRRWSLTVTNAWFEPHEGKLVVTNLSVADGTFRYDQFAQGLTNVSDMAELVLVGNLTVLASATNRYASCFVMEAHTVNTLTIGSNAVLYPQADLTSTNGASGGTAGRPHGLSVSLRCQSARIDGAVSGTDLGFGVKMGPGGSATSGSHGGRGSTGTFTYNTNTYGVLDRPSAPGSGGNVQAGGGGFKLRVDGALEVNGALDMSGSQLASTGPGSGGSLWVICDTLTGTGVLKAVGGLANSANLRGGGGGRLALEYRDTMFSGSFDVSGGAGGAAGFSGDGETGTLFRSQSVKPGVSDEGGAGGRSLDTQLSVKAGPSGVRFIRTVSRWDRSLEWTDRSLDVFSNQLDNVASYTLNGLVPALEYRVTTNGAPYGSGRIAVAGNGTLVISNVSLKGPVTVSVLTSPGSVILIR